MLIREMMNNAEVEVFFFFFFFFLGIYIECKRRQTPDQWTMMIKLGFVYDSSEDKLRRLGLLSIMYLDERTSNREEHWSGGMVNPWYLSNVMCVLLMWSIYDDILAIIHEGSLRTTEALLPELSRAATNYGTTCHVPPHDMVFVPKSLEKSVLFHRLTYIFWFVDLEWMC
jgi:hypothetical protein